MNNVSLVGRLTAEPSIRYTNDGSSIADFTVAVDRRFKTKDEVTADFIRCKAFGKTAEFIEKYFSKGSRIGLTGRIQTGSYTNKDGQKVYTTDVIAEAVEFVESKAGNTSNNKPAATSDFMDIPEGAEDDMPFN